MKKVARCDNDGVEMNRFETKKTYDAICDIMWVQFWDFLLLKVTI